MSKEYLPDIKGYQKGAYFSLNGIDSTRSQMLPNKIPVNRLTHLYIAFFRPLQDGNWDQSKTEDGQYYKNYLLYKDQLLVDTKKRNPNLKILAALSGGKAAYTANMNIILKNDMFRANLINNLKALINDGFDGIDIDYEQFPDEMGPYYLILAKEIREAIGSEKLLTATLGRDEMALVPAEAYKYCNYVNVMSYDFYYSNAKCEYNQNLYSISTVDYSSDSAKSCDELYMYLLSQGVPSNKITFGLEFGCQKIKAKGQGEEMTESLRDTAKDVKSFVLYKEMEDIMPGKTDKDAVSAGHQYNDGYFISFDNLETLQTKINYVKKNKLAGMFFWRLGFDFIDTHPLSQTKYIDMYLK